MADLTLTLTLTLTHPNPNPNPNQVPPQWRIPFIACVSFVWTFLLSSISSRDDAQQNAKP